MKILITSDLYAPSINGVVVSVLNLIEELSAKGHEVRVVTSSPNTKSYKEGNVYFIKSIPLKLYPGVRMPVSYRNQYVKELVEWDPDVIHSQCEFFSYQFARYISRKTMAPIVHTYHTLYEQYARYVVKNQRFSGKMIAVMSKRRLKHAHTVIAPSDKVKRFLLAYGIEKPIEVIPSGISLDKYKIRLNPEEIFKRRRVLNIPDDHQILLNLGRLGFEKNVSELLIYFKKLLTYNQKLTFLIVGGGPAKETLQDEAQLLGLDKQVIFTGMVKANEVQFFYQLGDIFVCASTSETQGLTYVEAMTAGLPLLCQKDACLDSLIQQGFNGYQYETEEEFCERALELLSEQDLKEKIAAYNEYISSRYSKEQFGNSIEAIYLRASLDKPVKMLEIEEK